MGLLGNLVGMLAGQVIQNNLDSPDAKGIASSLANKALNKGSKSSGKPKTFLPPQTTN